MSPPPADKLEPLRRRWLELIGRELPAAAAGRPDWPVRLDHCFARVILDHVHGRPWREVLPSPAYRNMSEDALRSAVAAAEAVLSGEADLLELDARSLRMRGKRPKRPQAS